MHDPPQTPPRNRESEGGGYARAASSGTRWTTAQGILNKLATAVAMYMVALSLSAEEFALASLVIVASGFIMVIPTFVMGDVVIAHQHHLMAISQVARRIVLHTAIVMTVVMLAAAPVVSLWYPQYPYIEMAVLLAITGARPIAEGLGVFPLSALRTDLRYREIALINGTVQLAASALTVVWAVLHPGAAAIVVPQVLSAVAKSAWCAHAARSSPSAARWRRRQGPPRRAAEVHRLLLREFSIASLAQYVHTVVCGLPLMVTAWFSSEAETGYFGFAFALANQASTIISYQLATVLQPIFGRLRTNPERQIAGFMRVIALMGAVAVPLSLLQAAFAEPLFALVFKEKWLPSVPFFVALCMGQTALFMVAPAMALLKAQGRFATYFVWQLAQALLCLVMFPIAVQSWGAIGVAWTDSALWIVSVPLAVWLGARVVGVTLGAVLRCFLLPWITAGPLALAGWLAWQYLPGSQPFVSAIALALIAPLCLFLSIMAVRVTQPAVFSEMTPTIRAVLTRIPLLGGFLARILLPG